MDMRLCFLQDNPKRAGTKCHARYERYKHATTVGQALSCGMLAPDLDNDFKHGFVAVVGGDGGSGDSGSGGGGAGLNKDAPAPATPADDCTVAGSAAALETSEDGVLGHGPTFGSVIYKSFDEAGIFKGEVLGLKFPFYQIRYEDGDTEDLTQGELVAALAKTPVLQRQYEAQQHRRRARC